MLQKLLLSFDRSFILLFIDIHYAASHNNHPKLLFYTQKYPELLNELDEDGNTALHNAAKYE